MLLSELANFATILSGLTVVISVMYLATQVRQATRHTRAQIQQARNQQIVEAEWLYATNAELRELIVRGDAADPGLSADQVRAYLHYISAQLFLFEDLYYQHRDGLIDAERHATTIRTLKDIRAKNAGFRAAWKVCRGGLGREFQILMEDIFADTKAQPAVDMVAKWHQLIAPDHV
jgi:hypothetical protein